MESRFVDFTSATPWEQFIAELEEIGEGWGLSNAGSYVGDRGGSALAADIAFGGRAYRLELVVSRRARELAWGEGMAAYSPTMVALCDDGGDFSGRQLERWFGLPQFLLLSRGGELLGMDVVGPEEAATVLSAATVALCNLNCSLPVFVPVHAEARGAFLGAASPGSTGAAGVDFEVDVTAKHMRPERATLSEFCSLLRAKCGAGPLEEETTNEIRASAHFRWAWVPPRNWVDAEQQEEWRTFHVTAGGFVPSWPVRVLEGPVGVPLWGAVDDPLKSLHLSVVWRGLREGRFVDNAVYSSLDPLNVAECAWHVSCAWADAETPLARSVQTLLGTFAQAQRLGENTLLSQLERPDDDAPPPETSVPAARAAMAIGSALGSLTYSLLQGAPQQEAPPPAEGLLDGIVASLFDAPPRSPRSPVRSAAAATGGGGGQPRGQPNVAPAATLLSVLAARAAEYGGLQVLAILWGGVVRELRRRWDAAELVPGVLAEPSSSSSDDDDSDDSGGLVRASYSAVPGFGAPPAPELDHCLLHQKLQMLNCCIHQRAMKRAELGVSGADSGASASETGAEASEEAGAAWGIDDDDLDDLDSFHDAETSPVASPVASPSPEPEPEPEPEAAEPPPPPSEADDGRLGVKRFVPGVRLLRTGEPLAEPVTQEVAPVTLDTLMQNQRVLENLGATPEASRIRQQLQMATLRADMEAFKAANPEAVLADFIRWHSPRDWEAWPDSSDGDADADADADADGQCVWPGVGRVSARMRDEGNPWLRSWEGARPVPAQAQRALFNAPQEAEKVLHYAATISPLRLASQLLAVQINNAHFVLAHAETPATQLPVVQEELGTLRALGGHAAQQLACMSGLDADEPVTEEQHVAALVACEHAIKSLEAAELLVARATSLLHKLPEQHELVERMLRVPAGDAVAVRSEAERALLQDMLSDPHVAPAFDPDTAFPRPHVREFVLRCRAQRTFQPAPAEAAVPHLLYACVDSDGVRVGLAVSESEV